MTSSGTTIDRYATTMTLESWAYVSGLCVGRESAFLQTRFIDELGTLQRDEVASRLSRTFIGSIESLGEFDTVVRQRLAAELRDILDVSPSPLPVDLIRLGPATDTMRAAVLGLPPVLDAASFHAEMMRLSLRSGDFAYDYAAAFDRSWPDPGKDARTAAALVIDASELSLLQQMASVSRDPVIEKWAAYRRGEAAARVAERALGLHLSREILRTFFYTGDLLSSKAQDFLVDFNEPAALAMYPPDVTPDNVTELMLALTGESIGNPYSPARVLHYLQLFLDQIRRIRLAVYRATGRIQREAA
jgi:hypothetical protein